MATLEPKHQRLKGEAEKRHHATPHTALSVHVFTCFSSSLFSGGVLYTPYLFSLRARLEENLQTLIA